MATNDITGDDIRTRPSSDKFRENWDAVFSNKDDGDEGEQEGQDD